MRTRLALCVAAAVLISAIGVVRAATGQQLADARIVVLLNRASQSIDALKVNEAQADVDRALALAEQIGDRVGLAMAHRSKGQLLRNQNKPKESIEWYERALGEFEALGNKAGVADVLSGLMASKILLGDNVQARELGIRAAGVFEQVDDPRNRAFTLRMLASIAPTRAEADRYLSDVLDIGTRIGDDGIVGNVYVMQASLDFQAGNYASAKARYERGIVAFERTGSIERLAAAHLSLGRVFRAHGDYEGAIQRYQTAIDLLAPTSDRYTIVEAWNAKAIALGFLGRNKESLDAYERGLALAREGTNERFVDFMEGNLAGALSAAGEHQRAIPLLEAAIGKKPDPSLMGYRQGQLAFSLEAVGRAADAVKYADEGLRIARELKQVDQVAIRLGTRAKVLEKLGRLEEAMTDVRESLAIHEQIRSTLVPTDFLKRGYSERVQASYDRAVDLLSKLQRTDEALEVAEQSRARAFLDLLAARDSTEVSLPTRGASVVAVAGNLASESMGKPADMAGIKQTAKRLSSTLLAFWVEDDETQVWVIRPDGRTASASVPLKRAQVNALVAATTAPLRSSGSATTRGAEGTAPNDNNQSSADDLTALPMRGLGLMALSRDDKSAWRELYKRLIEPIRAHLPARGGRITVIPHGPLFQLSFAALQSPVGRYLIEDYELHYAPAISALEFTGRRQAAVAANSKSPWAIVGDPATLPVVGDKPLPPLPGATREMASILALAPKGSVRLDGARADETSVSDVLAKTRPSLLHFATHGFVFDDPRIQPFLALNRTGKTDADDGRLTLDEVYGLHLSADLVVLSACRTGSGQVSSDGVVGLTRGFFYAGAPSVMATFWDVVDEATANLISGFYRNYAKARAKGSSLRSAQLALIADLRNGRVVVTAGGRRITLPEHPLLWAAFFLSGEP